MNHNGMNIWLPGTVVDLLIEHKIDDETLAQTLHRLLSVELPKQRETHHVKRKEKLYDISDLEVGESKIIPWRVDDIGNKLDQRPIHNSIKNHADLTGRVFDIQYKYQGVRVRRLE